MYLNPIYLDTRETFKYKLFLINNRQDFQKLMHMNKIIRRKIYGMIFAAVVFIMVLSVLTPNFIAEKKSTTTILDRNNNPINIRNNFGYGYGYGCDPHTPGYWKNHPNNWPVEDITIGETSYTKADAINVIKHPTNGDMTYSMFEHLVSAKLNVLMGCDPSCINEVIEDADEWMTIHPVGSDVDANSEAWDDGEPLKDMLDDYNNGFLCS